MTQQPGQTSKKIVLTYTGIGDDLDISLDSEGFGDDMELVTMYLHKTIQAILSSEETTDS